MKGNKKYLVTVALAPIFITPESKFLRDVNLCSPFIKLSTPFFINSKNTFPFSVKVTPFGLLLNKVISKSLSNFFIDLVIAGCEIYSASVALLILPIKCYCIKDFVCFVINFHIITSSYIKYE